jgi:hypothetical protein
MVISWAPTDPAESRTAARIKLIQTIRRTVFILSSLQILPLG